LLDLETALSKRKTLVETAGTDTATGKPVHGFEMHIGDTTGDGAKRPMLDLRGGKDGAISPDGQIMGCYLHGLFASDPFRHAFLDRIRSGAAAGTAYDARVEQTLDALADHLEQHIGVDNLLGIAGLRKTAATR
jgi:adenosylcobyric acid synthase